MRAQGCRCPAISPGGDFFDGSWRKVSAPTASASTVSPGRPAGGRGSWLPATQNQSRPAIIAERSSRIRSGQARRALAVMKAVAEADHDFRPVVVDHRLEPQQRRDGVVGRHQHAAPRQRRALFQMQVGDAEQAELREIERAAPVAERRLAGHRDLGAWAAPGRNIGSAPLTVCLYSPLAFPSPLRSTLPPPTEASRPPRRRPARGPTSSMIGTASGEMRSRSLCMIRPFIRDSMSASLLTSSRPAAASARVACSRMWSGSCVRSTS